ncbi:hypothetical protein AK812_SmicGene36508 [Symbiodinium microadriaticum]|uniref:Uncharacterized protein n=1 Tax=Symbiodinium microadriaticum TaxID=2951 RepID=A0A1Q9CIR2_SYMMI|nr:hypothetical protein AK812_SmicGene36508 [Symbiodinium microadriaticum]
MMGMWGPGGPGGPGGGHCLGAPMGAAQGLPGMMPCAGCGAAAVPAVPGAGMSLPAINEGQRHYMGQIVMGMKTGNLFQVAQNLEAAVNSQVPIPQEFLATVHLWMKSRAQTESGLSQMQLAQFIGASSFNSQVQANVQMLAQTPPAPASPPPPPPASPPPASPPLAGSALPASPPLPNSPMFIPSPPLPSSPMYVESPLMAGARDLRRPAEPSQGPKDPKGPGDRRPAEPAKPPSTEARDSRRPAEPDLPPRRRHPLPPPPSTTFGSACSSSYLGSAHIAPCEAWIVRDFREGTLNSIRCFLPFTITLITCCLGVGRGRNSTSEQIHGVVYTGRQTEATAGASHSLSVTAFRDDTVSGEETAGPEIERTKGVRHPKTCLLQKGGVSTWFPTCTGGEYNKYKSIWQETVQSEKPRMKKRKRWETA